MFNLNLFLKKNIIINFLTFIFILFIIVNFFHNSFEYYKKIENFELIKSIPEKPLFELKPQNLKFYISEELVSGAYYKNVFSKDCKITGHMGDRHKVRWVRGIAHIKLAQLSQNLNILAPYYLEVFLHSALIFLTLFLLKTYFPLNEKYSLIFLLFITFIFQHALGEYSYSIFDMFLITIATCLSKIKKNFFFLIICCLGILNRETGFLMAFIWLIFNNKDFKFLIFTILLTSILFLLVNVNIFSCLYKLKFFAPMEYQTGQINYSDVLNMNIFSAIKTIIINYIIPFGAGFYYHFKAKINNKYLLLIFLIYLFIFLIASPLGKIELKLLLLPYLWLFIFFKEKKI